MACYPCQQQRQAFVRAARTFDLRGAARAVGTAAAINYDKVRGLSQAEVDAKYGGRPVVRATPYRRPPDRTV